MSSVIIYRRMLLLQHVKRRASSPDERLEFSAFTLSAYVSSSANASFKLKCLDFFNKTIIL